MCGGLKGARKTDPNTGIMMGKPAALKHRHERRERFLCVLKTLRSVALHAPSKPSIEARNLFERGH